MVFISILPRFFLRGSHLFRISPILLVPLLLLLLLFVGKHVLDLPRVLSIVEVGENLDLLLR